MGVVPFDSTRHQRIAVVIAVKSSPVNGSYYEPMWANAESVAVMMVFTNGSNGLKYRYAVRRQCQHWFNLFATVMTELSNHYIMANKMIFFVIFLQWSSNRFVGNCFRTALVRVVEVQRSVITDHWSVMADNPAMANQCLINGLAMAKQSVSNQ